MILSKHSVFLLLWAFQSFLLMLASEFTVYPNQVYVGLSLILLSSSFVVFKDTIRIFQLNFIWMLLPLTYSLVYIVVSIYGADFEVSLNNHIQYLPLVCIDFFLAFLVGYKYDEQKIFRFFKYAATLTTLYLIFKFSIFPDGPKYSPPLNVAMSVAIAMTTKEVWVLLLIFAMVFFSTKKTMLVISLFGAFFSYYLITKNRSIQGLERWSIKKKSTAVSMKTGLYLLAAVAVGYIFLENILAVVERFLVPVEEDDPFRAKINFLSLEMLADNFPYGIGFGAFSSLTASELNYQTYTAQGEVVVGASIHSTYVSWMLEGGGAIVIVVAALFAAFIYVARKLWRNKKSRMFSIVAIVWMIQGMILGVAHQWHATFFFWMLFGMVFGVYVRYKKQTDDEKSFASHFHP